MVNRGADILVRTLTSAGVDWVAAMSGNQVMSIFDAAIDGDLELIHVRHEAAAVHMADAWGRLTGNAGVALVPAGPGFANTLSALYVARMAESPLVLLSGQSPIARSGRGPFQEMAQAEIAGYVAKASWVVTDVEFLGAEVQHALALARYGRPGPVHLSVPVDVLEAESQAAAEESASGSDVQPIVSEFAEARRCCDALASAERPLVLTGPALCRRTVRGLLDRFADRTRIPVVPMESPRGVNDPCLGAIAELLPRADLVLLLSKQLDFTLQIDGEPVFDSACEFLQIDSEPSAIALTEAVLADPARLRFSAVADPLTAVTAMIDSADGQDSSATDWMEEVRATVDYRPAAWSELDSGNAGRLHPVEACRAIQQFLDEEDSVFISDGGEFGQWAQACITAKHRVINGPSGAIGGGIPFALAARRALPDARIVAVLGDGTFGFHGMECDTALRHSLPFIAVIGNDAAWNAEYQIQVRKYGNDRAVGCELLPTRYDRIVEAAGGHGEFITRAGELPAALQRAESAGLPACVNVALEPTAAPVMRRR